LTQTGIEAGCSSPKAGPCWSRGIRPAIIHAPIFYRQVAKHAKELSGEDGGWKMEDGAESPSAASLGSTPFSLEKTWRPPCLAEAFGVGGCVLAVKSSRCCFTLSTASVLP